MKVFTLITSLLLCFLTTGAAYAQTGHATALKFDKSVHNFGKFSVDDGPQQCTFTYTNQSDEPVVINTILSSCGCSVPKWDKAPIMPGASGTVEVTYLNDQGPFPFDKTLTVYVSSSEKPILLRITGVAYEKGKSLEEQFPARYGPLGMRSYTQNGGQIEQGLKRAESENVINLSDQTVTVDFANVSKGLSISAEPRKIKPGASATISYTIDTKEVHKWGRNRFYADFVCNGKPVKDHRFVTETVIVTPYTSLTDEQLKNAPQIVAEKSSLDFGKAKAGEEVSVQFKLRNTGKSMLRIYKIETNGAPVKIVCPAQIAAGKSSTVNVTITPKKADNYEVFTITLVTNSPERPLMNLFASGEVTNK